MRDRYEGPRIARGGMFDGSLVRRLFQGLRPVRDYLPNLIMRVLPRMIQPAHDERGMSLRAHHAVLVLLALRQQQVQVAELMPEIAPAQGRAVDSGEMLAAGQRFQHRQMRRSRLVEAGEQR